MVQQKESTVNEILKALYKQSNPEKAEVLQRFFKTGKGEYGEGDLFIGIKMPEIRNVVKTYKTSSSKVIEQLLKNKVHEVRMCGVLMIVQQYKQKEDEKWFQFYLKQTQYINNWDLVDVTVGHILGQHILNHPSKKDIFYNLIKSNNLWEQRMAIVGQIPLIKKGQFQLFFLLAEQVLYHPHDLMHKALGWMLREVGKVDLSELQLFLQKYAATMPRTTLRYAIEKFTLEERKTYMNMKNQIKIKQIK